MNLERTGEVSFKYGSVKVLLEANNLADSGELAFSQDSVDGITSYAMQAMVGVLIPSLSELVDGILNAPVPSSDTVTTVRSRAFATIETLSGDVQVGVVVVTKLCVDFDLGVINAIVVGQYISKILGMSTAAVAQDCVLAATERAGYTAAIEAMEETQQGAAVPMPVSDESPRLTGQYL